jgi:Tfp pilus assembly protein PilO
MTGNRLWMIGVALAAVVVVALGWLVGISPMLSQGSIATEQVRSVDAQNSAQRAAMVTLKTQYDDLSTLRAQLKKIQGVIPDTSDLDDFLDELEEQAQDANVTISSFTSAEGTLYGGSAVDAPAPPAAAAASSTATPSPAPSAAAAAGTTATAATQAPASLAGMLFTIPITVAVKGQPDDVMAFTDSVQKNGRFFLVTSSTFTGASTPDTAGGTLTGYVFVVQNPSDEQVTPK